MAEDTHGPMQISLKPSVNIDICLFQETKFKLVDSGIDNNMWMDEEVEWSASNINFERTSNFMLKGTLRKCLDGWMD